MAGPKYPLARIATNAGAFPAPVPGVVRTGMAGRARTACPVRLQPLASP